MKVEGLTVMLMPSELVPEIRQLIGCTPVGRATIAVLQRHLPHNNMSNFLGSRGPRAGFFRDNFHVVAQSGDESHEAVHGESTESSIKQRRYLRLVDAEY